MTDAVMRMPGVQRQVEPEEEEEIRSKSIASAAPEVTLEMGCDIQSVKGTGQPLSAFERAFFEPRFRADFSNVCVHSEPEAANTATAIDARAFTVGNHIAVDGGEYNFQSLHGKQLMAHKLTYVLQNSNPDTVRRNPVAGLKAAE